MTLVSSTTSPFSTSLKLTKKGNCRKHCEARGGRMVNEEEGGGSERNRTRPRLTPTTARADARRDTTSVADGGTVYILRSQMRDLETISAPRHNGRGPDSSL